MRRSCARAHPALSRLFPAAPGIRSKQAISLNVSANLLGLGNAATPYGVRAAGFLSRLSGGACSDDLCMLVVINSASLQIIPATVAGLRSAAGARAPFDILPAVWITTAAAALVGILSAKLFARLGKKSG
jgi:spore maturation protein A